MDVDRDMTRAELLVLLETLGHGAPLEAVDDVTLEAVIRSRLALVTDATKIERALAMPLSVEWRGRVVGRRIQLEQIAKAPPRKEPPPKGLTAIVPAILDGMTHFIDGNSISHRCV